VSKAAGRGRGQRLPSYSRLRSPGYLWPAATAQSARLRRRNRRPRSPRRSTLASLVSCRRHAQPGPGQRSSSAQRPEVVRQLSVGRARQIQRASPRTLVINKIDRLSVHPRIGAVADSQPVTRPNSMLRSTPRSTARESTPRSSGCTRTTARHRASSCGGRCAPRSRSSSGSGPAVELGPGPTRT
jgi:hypothetical protein